MCLDKMCVSSKHPQTSQDSFGSNHRLTIFLFSDSHLTVKSNRIQLMEVLTVW